MTKQINAVDHPRPRGRPKKDGELKESSVRIRPALREKLAAAAVESGESIARELEERLEATFSEVPRRGVTHELLQQIALVVREVEGVTLKQWDKDLTTWAMLRELMANGPIADTVPHPDSAKAKDAIAANAELAELKAEQTGLRRALAPFGAGTGVLGARLLDLSESAAIKAAIEGRDDLPADVHDILKQQAIRLEELDAQVSELQTEVNKAVLPYWKARKDARDYFYKTRGVPDLLAWLTSPQGADEPPARRFGMFANRPNGPNGTDSG